MLSVFVCVVSISVAVFAPLARSLARSLSRSLHHSPTYRSSHPRLTSYFTSNLYRQWPRAPPPRGNSPRGIPKPHPAGQATPLPARPGPAAGDSEDSRRNRFPAPLDASPGPPARPGGPAARRPGPLPDRVLILLPGRLARVAVGVRVDERVHPVARPCIAPLFYLCLSLSLTLSLSLSTSLIYTPHGPSRPCIAPLPTLISLSFVHTYTTQINKQTCHTHTHVYARKRDAYIHVYLYVRT